MSWKKIFTLNWKTFIVDVVLVAGGYFLSTAFIRFCASEFGGTCHQSPLVSIGEAIVYIAIIHFIINLLIYFVRKLHKMKINKPVFKKKRKSKK